MAFNPNEPQNGEEVDADVLRNQFNSLNDAINIIPVGPQGPQGVQGAQGDTGPQGPQGDPGGTNPETDPVFAAWLATPPLIRAFTNDAGFSSFNPNNAGELYNCFGIFDGGNRTNGVRLGGNQVDLQLWNGGQTVVVLSAGQKQLIGYADYANPVPLVAAGWADGVLRDGAGNAYLTDISSLTAGAVTSLAGHNLSELANDTGFMANPMTSDAIGAIIYNGWDGVNPGGTKARALPAGTIGQVLTIGRIDGMIAPTWVDDTALQPNPTADGTYPIANDGTTSGQLTGITITNGLTPLRKRDSAPKSNFLL